MSVWRVLVCGISLGFKLVYWVICGIKGPKLTFYCKCKFHVHKIRGTVVFSLKTARLPVNLGSILLKVKQLVWKMHQEMCHSLLTTSAFSPTLSIQNKHLLALTITDLCNPHIWLNVHLKISESIGWFIVKAFLHSNRIIIYYRLVSLYLSPV